MFTMQSHKYNYRTKNQKQLLDKWKTAHTNDVNPVHISLDENTKCFQNPSHRLHYKVQNHPCIRQIGNDQCHVTAANTYGLTSL